MLEGARPGWVEDLKREPVIVIGYHGTSTQNARRILREGFRIRPNDWDWLGEGVYFWQDAPLRALLWAQNWPRRGKGPVAVIRARLALADCMDLLDNDWNDILGRIPAQFEDQLKKQGRARLTNNRPYGCNRLDCAFFNYLVRVLGKEGKLIRTIRSAVKEGNPIQEASPICFDSHVQIAVRDLSLIDDVRMVYSE